MSKTLKTDLQNLCSGPVHTDPEHLDAFSVDYGAITRRVPKAVARPATADEVARLVVYANRHDLPVSPRAGGFSFAGQSLNEGGLVLDLRSLDRIGPLDSEAGTIEAQGAAQWKDVVEMTVPQGWLPPALTSYVCTSVGGTLSAAGLGMSTFRYGTQIDHCESLEVVTPTGELVSCSEHENRDLFDHVLGGFGQFGIITKSRQRLRRCGRRVRTYFLLYDDLGAHLEDHVRLVEGDAAQFIDAMVRPCYHGLRVQGDQRLPFHSYLYPLNVTLEADDSEAFDDQAFLGDLSFSKWIYAEDLDLRDFIILGHADTHISPRIAEVFVDVLVPWDRLEDFLPKVEQHIFPRIVHVEHTILWPMTRDSLERPMFRVPDTPLFMGIGLYSRVPQSAAEDTVAASRAFVDLALSMGSTYYLTGSMRFDSERFARQFGDAWSSVCEAKRRYDPKGLLNPGLFAWPDH
ncbi:MAG: FAD-binding oxidoreductase [Thermoanaerobaculia bacterium]|nr:FAD-binding oxidoreductase [Thermoanaerobaculia bacterium]